MPQVTYNLYLLVLKREQRIYKKRKYPEYLKNYPLETESYFYLSIIYFHLFVFLLYSLSWLQTFGPPASASQVLESIAVCLQTQLEVLVRNG